MHTSKVLIVSWLPTVTRKIRDAPWLPSCVTQVRVVRVHWFKTRAQAN
jgi:hypothetical protein